MTPFELLNFGFGIVGIGSALFSVYVYFKTESKKIAEAANVAMMRESVRSSTHAAIGLTKTLNAVVQIPKTRDVTVEELQDFARIARTQGVMLLEILASEHARLKEWRFGVLAESAGPVPVADRVDGKQAPELEEQAPNRTAP